MSPSAVFFLTSIWFAFSQFAISASWTTPNRHHGHQADGSPIREQLTTARGPGADSSDREQ